MARFNNFRFLLSSVFSLCLFFAFASFAHAQKTEDEGIELGKDSNTEINVRNADIAAIVRVFSKKTKRNYILDERVKGKVSIYLPGKVSSQDSIRILDSVLAYKGFAAVPIGENLWKVIPAKEARQSTVPTVMGDENGSSASVVTRLVNLKNISADEAKQILQQLISPDGFLNSYAATNSLIIIDNEDNISRLMGILDSIDVSSSDRDMTIIPIENAEATDIATKLNELLGSGDKDPKNDLLNRNTANITSRNMAQQQAANMAGGNAGGEMGLNNTSSTPQIQAKQPKIIADERTNSIIVVADEASTARIQALVEQLDSPIDMSGLKFYVYHCQHAKAEELADVLAGLVGGEKSGSGGSGKKATSGTSGSDGDLINTSGSSREASKSRTKSRMEGQTRTPGKSRNAGNQGSNEIRSVELGENFTLSADPATNTLIIFGNKTQFEKVRALLQTLDVKRRQVLVEAMLLEVTLASEEKLKTSFIASAGGADGGVIAQSNGSDILGMLSNPASIEDFSIAAASAGTLTIGGGDKQVVIPSQTMLISAIQKNTNVNLLSAPNILATNNEAAEIVVGQNIPFIASTSTDQTNLSNTFNQIDRQDVGITLRLTPQISSRDTVTLSIFTEVSSVVSTDPTLGPTTAIRTSETSVIAKDGQMIVTGGLMADENNSTDNGVPYLKDIPVLGHLFRFSNDTRRKTNLLILITPRIVKDQYDARDLTIEGREMMEKEIELREIYPNRKELLHRQSVDRVAESVPYEGEAPSTILPPLEKEAASKNAPKAEATKNTNSNIREFSVDAHIPSEPKFVEPKKSENKPAAQKAGESFVVLQVQGDSKELEKSLSALPFAISKEGRLIAIRLPLEANNKVGSSFVAGALIGYAANGKTTMFRVLGRFNNINEATASFTSLPAQWYELSPYEIMKFGSGPWVKAGS